MPDSSPHSELLALLDYLCEDSLDAPLSHTDRLAEDGTLRDYEISAKFHELKLGIAGLVEQLEAAQKDAREWRLTAETNGDNWHRIGEQFEVLREFFIAHREVEQGVTDFDLHAEAVERLRAATELAYRVSFPASEPSIDGDESCFDCGAPRKQGCGCWLNNPYHLWASRAARQTDA